MITLITMALGFLAPLIPDFLKLFQDKRDKQHEIALLEIQTKNVENSHLYKMDEIGVSAYSQIVQSAHREQTDITLKSSNWVIDFTASVRPTVTYLFVIAFIGFKAAMFFAAVNPSLPWQNGLSYLDAMALVWGGEENAGFWGIIAYWFGDRAMAKRR